MAREPATAAEPGFVLPLLLFAGFRTLIDELHAELAGHGHPDVRPAYGFALQAIGPDGATASELGRKLGVSKQAAGKTVDRLEALGYARRAEDPADARRKRIELTTRGADVLARSARTFDDLRDRLVAEVGVAKVRDLEATLRALAKPGSFRLDMPGWFGG